MDGMKTDAEKLKWLLTQVRTKDMLEDSSTGSSGSGSDGEGGDARAARRATVSASRANVSGGGLADGAAGDAGSSGGGVGGASDGAVGNGSDVDLLAASARAGRSKSGIKDRVSSLDAISPSKYEWINQELALDR